MANQVFHDDDMPSAFDFQTEDLRDLWNYCSPVNGLTPVSHASTILITIVQMMTGNVLRSRGVAFNERREPIEETPAPAAEPDDGSIEVRVRRVRGEYPGIIVLWSGPAKETFIELEIQQWNVTSVSMLVSGGAVTFQGIPESCEIHCRVRRLGSAGEWTPWEAPSTPEDRP